MVDVTAKASRHKTKHLSHDDRRFGDLSKWARHQYGDGNGDFILPDNAEGRATALAIVTHQPFKSTTWLFDFCRDRAPWLDPDEIDRKRLRRKKADVLGRELGITAAVREQLGIRSFGACDRTREERAAMAKQRRRQRDRERNQKKRLEAGRQSRADYLAQSVSRTKPGSQQASALVEPGNAIVSQVCRPIILILEATHLRQRLRLVSVWP